MIHYNMQVGLHFSVRCSIVYTFSFSFKAVLADALTNFQLLHIVPESMGYNGAFIFDVEYISFGGS